jgi:glycyl-tRNA synthetase
MDKNNIPQFHSAPTYAAPPPRAPAPRVHGEAVRVFKADDSASKADVDAADEALKVLKIKAGVAACRLQQAVGAGASGAAREELRQAVVNTLVRKLFYIPSFKIYRGVAGHYEYAPCSLGLSATSQQ